MVRQSGSATCRCLVASDASGIKKSLDVLVERCKEWGVKINVAMSGTMHIHNKKAKRCEVGRMVRQS